MKRLIISAFFLSLFVTPASSAEKGEWKNYENPALGFRLSVKRDWTEIAVKETKQTGSVTFNVASKTKAGITASRMKADYSFEVWMSSEVLLQMYEPGYETASVQVGGRKAVRVTGQAKDGRRAEAYFSNHPPYIDQLEFDVLPDFWDTYEADFKTARQSFRWTN